MKESWRYKRKGTRFACPAMGRNAQTDACQRVAPITMRHPISNMGHAIHIPCCPPNVSLVHVVSISRLMMSKHVQTTANLNPTRLCFKTRWITVICWGTTQSQRRAGVKDWSEMAIARAHANSFANFVLLEIWINHSCELLWSPHWSKMPVDRQQRVSPVYNSPRL